MKTNKLDQLEKILWNSARDQKISLPEEGFERRVMRRIEQARKEKAPSFLELLGTLCWRWMPVAAGFLIVLGAWNMNSASDGSEWWMLLAGKDASWGWLTQGGF
ncbi:MAG: hypothetical protein HYS08_09270 [Chlamydiae bacterium]|nr:hypothetical protein [Chlamydiota bacterium]MBI3267328.1 hypothetical protein [Chlamydiota bacterium]